MNQREQVAIIGHIGNQLGAGVSLTQSLANVSTQLRERRTERELREEAEQAEWLASPEGQKAKARNENREAKRAADRQRTLTQQAERRGR